MFTKPNPSLPVPIYVQLKDQILHAIDTGLLAPGAQLPGIRNLAQSLVVNPNTVIRVYHELEQEGALEARQGLGVFVATRRDKTKAAHIAKGGDLLASLVDRLRDLKLNDSEIRRLLEAALTRKRTLQRS